MVDLRFPELAEKLCDDAEVAVALLERRDRRQEIARVREPARADRPELGQAKVRAVVLANVAACGPVELDAEFHAARHDADFAGRDVQDAELGSHGQRALLRHDQKLTVGVVEEAVGHRRVGGIKVHGGARLLRGVAVAAHRDEARDEIRGLRGIGSGCQRS